MSALQPSRSYRITGYSPAISNGYRQRLFSMGLLPARRCAWCASPKTGQVREFPVKLFGGSDYRIAFSFHRGEEKYASFSTKPGWGTLDLYVDTELSVSTQPPPEGLIQQQ